MLRRKLYELQLRIAKLEDMSEEGRFYNNPLTKIVREFAESDAISNDPEVAENASKTLITEKDKGLIKSEYILAPPTPTEVKKKPGGEEFSTLTQLVIETEEKTKTLPVVMSKRPPASKEEGSEQSVHNIEEREIPKSEKLKAVREVMKKKSSIYMVRRMTEERDRDSSREDKRREDSRRNESERIRDRAKAKDPSERNRERLEQERESQRQKGLKIRKELDRESLEKAKAKKEEAIKKVKETENQIRNYAKLSGKEKRSLTLSIRRMLPRNEAHSMSTELRNAEAKDKTKVLYKYIKLILSNLEKR